ncbi:uncharacterized protein RCC_06223 [Ramularia collo-cygni]|uniref:Uncharacterized protein n=1 Tax=Ramularia collo-cygni TaxID=112498 RepID=A0A2D3VCB9_9PEZI|nr:uncharacterized protein RCC_06223 [Ramularia collo-cygni]CZT20364.1 uncharacterized protein RCC_06223 [Ramularia collo-cygni]
MKTSGLFTYLAIGTATVTFAAPAPTPGDIHPRTLLPGLNLAQTECANGIISQAKKDGVGAHGCQVAITASIVESNLLKSANKAVPESLTYPHDQVMSPATAPSYSSGGGGGTGPFKQQAPVYKDVKCNMEPSCSAGQFFDALKKIEGWKVAAVDILAMKVQKVSEKVEFEKKVGVSVGICKAGGL